MSLPLDLSSTKHAYRKDTTSLAEPAAVLRKRAKSVLRELLGAANHRYLAFLSQLDEPGSGIGQLNKIARPVRRDSRSHRGFNLFHGDDTPGTQHHRLRLATPARNGGTRSC